MSIDENTAAKVAKLARIEVESQDLTVLAKDPHVPKGLFSIINLIFIPKKFLDLINSLIISDL